MENTVDVTVKVPAHLKAVADMVQGIVDGVQRGDQWTVVLSSALPQVFSLGSSWAELKEEIKKPSAAVLGGLAIGSGVAAYLTFRAAKAVQAELAAPAVQA